jgi:hypothetical protein
VVPKHKLHVVVQVDCNIDIPIAMQEVVSADQIVVGMTLWLLFGRTSVDISAGVGTEVFVVVIGLQRLTEYYSALKDIATASHF